MSYIKDYHRILNGTFIENKVFDGLISNEIETSVKDLIVELIQLSNNVNNQIESVLKVMTQISIFKQALEMEVRANMIPDTKSSDRIYVQIRGAVPVSKGNRVWVGHYIGKKNEVCDEAGNVLPYHMKKGREAVIWKVVQRLRDMEEG